MTLILRSNRPLSSVTKYKRSVPGTAVRVSIRKNSKKRSDIISSNSSSSPCSKNKKRRSKSKIRHLRSRVLTLKHNIFKSYGVKWVRTRSGSYVRQRIPEPTFQVFCYFAIKVVQNKELHVSRYAENVTFLKSRKGQSYLF